jgi:hypothetical protein
MYHLARCSSLYSASSLSDPKHGFELNQGESQVRRENTTKSCNRVYICRCFAGLARHLNTRILDFFAPRKSVEHKLKASNTRSIIKATRFSRISCSCLIELGPGSFLLNPTLTANGKHRQVKMFPHEAIKTLIFVCCSLFEPRAKSKSSIRSNNLKKKRSGKARGVKCPGDDGGRGGGCQRPNRNRPLCLAANQLLAAVTIIHAAFLENKGNPHDNLAAK